MNRVTVVDTSALLLLASALLNGCAEGTIPAARSLDDPSNPAAPEAALTTPALFTARPAISAPEAPHDMGGMTHDMGGMKHDMGAMKDGGSP